MAGIGVGTKAGVFGGELRGWDDQGGDGLAVGIGRTGSVDLGHDVQDDAPVAGIAVVAVSAPVAAAQMKLDVALLEGAVGEGEQGAPHVRARPAQATSPIDDGERALVDGLERTVQPALPGPYQRPLGVHPYPPRSRPRFSRGSQAKGSLPSVGGRYSSPT